jgi:CheY-like chemotaxis protein
MLLKLKIEEKAVNNVSSENIRQKYKKEPILWSKIIKIITKIIESELRNYIFVTFILHVRNKKERIILLMSKFKNVLCINDNEVTLWIQKQSLLKTSLFEQVHTFLNGLDGLIFCKNYLDSNFNLDENYPRLIILDLHMPLMDGWQFLDHFTIDYWPYFKETKVLISSFPIDKSQVEKVKKYPFVINLINSSISAEYLIHLFPDSIG